jgi:glycosyltransferase involved in cell wall biosynthesis
MRVAQVVTDNRENFRQYQKKQPWFHAASEALLQGFAMFPEVEVHVVSCTQRPMPASPEKLAENIWFHSLLVPKIGWLRTGYQGCVRAVRRKLRELQPDIVHGQGTERDCALNAVFSGFPNVLTIHGNMVNVYRVYTRSLFHWCAARLEDLALRRTSAVFCNSAYTETLVQPRANRTWRVPNALREAFLTEQQARPATDTPVIVNVGVISAHKRQLEVLDVAEELHRRGCRFRLHFIGGLSQKSAYGRKFTERLQAAKQKAYADFTSHLEVSDLVRTLDGAHAMIHFPSEESFGLVAAEALARNVKFFGARVGGLVDIAERVEGAELFGANSLNELTSSVEHWIKNGFPRPQGAAATIRSRYHPKIVAERHIEIYRKLLREVDCRVQEPTRLN